MEEKRRIERFNRLDDQMTPAQVARRRFKSTFPRKAPKSTPTAMQAMAKVMELLDQFRGEQSALGLDPNDVSAGLVYLEGEDQHTAELPAPEKVGSFVEEIMALDKPQFLGVLFIQTDREAKRPDQRYTLFCWPFMGGPDAEKRLLIARHRQQAKTWNATQN